MRACALVAGSEMYALGEAGSLSLRGGSSRPSRRHARANRRDWMKGSANALSAFLLSFFFQLIAHNSTAPFAAPQSSTALLPIQNYTCKCHAFPIICPSCGDLREQALPHSFFPPCESSLLSSFLCNLIAGSENLVL